MHERFKLRLRSEILLNLVIIMVFSMLLLALMVLKFSRDFMEENAKKDHIRLVYQIKQIFKLTESSLNAEELQLELGNYLNSVKQLSQGSLVLLFNLSSTGPALIGTEENSLTGKEIEAIKAKIKIEIDRDNPEPVYSYSKAIFFISKLERIESYISLRLISEPGFMVYLCNREVLGGSKFKKVKVMVIIYTGIFALVMIAFGYVMLSKSIIRPLEKISAKAVDIASGNLDTRIELNQQNEIGELARSITVMTENLLSNQRELEFNLKAVEKLNKALNDAQREIIRIEKLASIGRLSSGIAHEIGNPLSAVMGYIEILKRESGGEDLDLLERSGTELQRISKIIKQLLDFSKPVPVELKSVNLGKYLDDFIESIKKQEKFKSIDIGFEQKDNTENITIDEDQLRQVLLNLLLNCADAINERHKGNGKGKIAISLSTSSLAGLEEVKNAYFFKLDRRKDDPPDSFFHNERSRKRKSDPPKSKSFRKRNKPVLGYPQLIFDDDEKLVQITVEDNGVGIKKDEVNKIFDPFYTTKDPGEGTGLGLYMTANTIDSMGGYIDVLSEYGKGTLFMILLPIKGVFVDNL